MQQHRAGVAQHDAFAFFLSRCKQDQEVRQRLQHAAEHREDISSEMRKRGAIVLDILLKMEKGKDTRQNHLKNRFETS